MKDRTQIALNKLRKARVKNTTKLNAVEDAVNTFDRLQTLVFEMNDLTSSINNESLNAYAIKESAQASYDEWEEKFDEYNDLQTELSDQLNIIEEKADELGVATFEFMPDYQEMVDISTENYIDDFNNEAYDLLDMNY